MLAMTLLFINIMVGVMFHAWMMAHFRQKYAKKTYEDINALDYYTKETDTAALVVVLALNVLELIGYLYWPLLVFIVATPFAGYLVYTAVTELAKKHPIKEDTE